MNCPSCGVESPGQAGSCPTCGTIPAAFEEPGSSSSLEILTSAGFVGRQHELRELRSALEDALSGNGRLVLLAGEPGIGKTRIAQEFSALAETQGVKVFWGRCYDGEGAPPYWPWMQLLNLYIEQQDSEKLWSQMGPGVADIAEIIPELKAKVPDLEPAPTLEPEQARFRLFASVTNFLKNAAISQSLILVLDDLHWADQSSLLLLDFIALELHNISLLLIGTYRDVEVSRQDPLPQTLGNLVRTSGFRRLQLRGLSQSELAELLENTSGWESPPTTIAALHQRTQGNPLFVTEILRGLSQEKLIDPSRYLSDIPEGVKDAIGRRLGRLSEECNRILTTASVIGRKFELRLLRLVVKDVEEDHLLTLVEEAIAARIVEEMPASPMVYQFSHALIQDTLAGELSSARRARLHAEIGEALEKVYTRELEPHAAELAYHFAEAEPLLGPEKLSDYSILAGEQALAAYAWEEALTHFHRVLAAKDGQPMDSESANSLFGLGRAYIALLQRGEAVDNLSRAFEYYAKVGDVPRAVAVASHPIFPGIGRMRVTDLISRALELVPPHSHEAGNLLCRYGLSVGLELGDYEKAQEAFSRSVAMAQHGKDVALEAQTLTNAAIVETFHVHWREGVYQGLRAIELAQEISDLQAEATARIYTVTCLVALGEADAVQYHRAGMLAMSERLRERGWLSLGFRINALLSYMEGDWQATRDFISRGLEAGGLRDSDLLTNLVRLDYEVGAFEHGEVNLGLLVDTMNRSTPGPTLQCALPALVIPIAAHISGTIDRFDVAERAANAVLSSPWATPLATTYARVGLGLIAVQKGDEEAAEEQYIALQPLLGSVVAAANTVTDRIAGLLSMTMGKLDQAISHFQSALAFCRKAGYRPDQAWTCHDYANALLQRASTSSAQTYDRQKATALMDESLALSLQLGMRPLTERVVSLQERAQSPLVDSPNYPEGLTHREVEVLRLIAAGKSNREIADELVISIRTVANHVANILNKTTSANRAEAATFASRHDIV